MLNVYNLNVQFELSGDDKLRTQFELSDNDKLYNLNCLVR